MKTELLTIPGCPHGETARAVFSRALELEGVGSAGLATTEITSDAAAAAASFHGSPSFLLDGTDLFPSTTPPAMACRVYTTAGGLAGQPDLESLRLAIRRARQAGPANGAHTGPEAGAR